MQKLTRSLFAIGALAGLAACGDDVSVQPPAPAPAPTPIAITGISVSPSAATIRAGTTVQLSASVTTNGGAGTIALNSTWVSSNTAVATVSSTGLVTATALGGTASITATSVGNTGFSASALVTVTVPAVQSVSISPTSAALTVGQTLAAAATVVRDAGVAGTVTWSSGNTAIASVVSGTGVITANAVGTTTITATSTADASKSAAMSLTVSAVPNNLISLTVSPSTVNIGPGGTTQLTPTVNTVGSPTVTYTYTSSNTAIATVTSPGGLVSGVSNGTATITVSANAGVNTLSAAVTVNVAAASVSIQSLTTCLGGPPCAVGPVNLAGVAGQIEATLNINSGSQQIDSVVVRIDATHAASQVFGVNGAPAAPITLSVNTARFDANFVPSFLNGTHTIKAEIYPHGAVSPTASNTVQFTLTNPDVVYYSTTGLVHTGNSATNGVPATWWRGGFNYSSNPVNYSGAITSITYTSTTCGGATGTTGPSFTAVFSCAGVEAPQNIINAVAVVYPASYTLTAPPTTFMTAASPGFVPGNAVYAVLSTNEDNVGPTTSTPVFNSPGQGGWHGTPTTYSVSATDAGIGILAANPTITEVTTSLTPVTAATQLAETLTPAPYSLQGNAVADILGNPGMPTCSTCTFPNSAVFGVDLVVLDAQYADRATSGVLATIFPLVQRGFVYAEAVPTVTNPSWTLTNDGLTEVVAVNAIDTRSGLDNPNAQVSSMTRRTAAGSSSCASGASDISTILSDSYVETTTPAQLDCGLAAGSRVGYYTWKAAVKDRAGNSKTITDGAAVVDSVYMAIDELAPNITGLGFLTTLLYTGGQPAPYSISANDDLELKDGQIALGYLGMTPTITWPFGSADYTSGVFGAPFDTPIVNVINGASLTLAYYVSNWDVVTAAPFVPGIAGTGNIAGFTSSGVNNSATASVRDVANQVASLAPVPVLSTQLAPRGSAPSYGSSMLHFDIFSNLGGVVTVRHIGPTSTTVTFCDRIELYEGVGGVAGGDPSTLAGTLTHRATITAAPTITDNGFQRFWTYTSAVLSPAIAAGNGVAACFKSGSAILSRLF